MVKALVLVVAVVIVVVFAMWMGKHRATGRTAPSASASAE